MEWSYSVAVELFHLIQWFIRILLHKNISFINGYDVLRALQV